MIPITRTVNSGYPSCTDPSTTCGTRTSLPSPSKTRNRIAMLVRIAPVRRLALEFGTLAYTKSDTGRGFKIDCISPPPLHSTFQTALFIHRTRRAEIDTAIGSRNVRDRIGDEGQHLTGRGIEHPAGDLPGIVDVLGRQQHVGCDVDQVVEVDHYFAFPDERARGGLKGNPHDLAPGIDGKRFAKRVSLESAQILGLGRAIGPEERARDELTALVAGLVR